MTPSSSHARAFATVTGPTALYTGADGTRHTVHDVTDIRIAILKHATDDARRTGTPVELVTSGDHGRHHLLVQTDGTLTPLTDTTAAAEVGLAEFDDPPLEVPDSRTSEPPDSPTRELPEGRTPDVLDSAAGLTATVGGQLSRRSSRAPAERVSFITPATDAPPAATGWRGFLARIGMRVGPSPYELARSEWERKVSRQWAGCRTIAVVNGKGGVGKTMTTAMLAAVYARHGGGNVLAWDNNDTRGTLGWRTEPGLYDTTIRDLLPAAETLLNLNTGVSDITRYVHHQGADRYDVLRSNPELLAADQRLGTDQFDLLMKVAARFYRLVVFDSGNDESSDRWIRMIDSTRQLVIPTLASPESAESALLLLEALRDRSNASRDLADNAIVVVTQAEPHDAAHVRDIAAGFTPHVRAVETIPFDPALKSGPLRFENLRPATRDAWLRVAAAATDTL
ncbi:ParA family protein [Microbacterium sp.]|uniref:ParA family protein n=1 Tax=Microbacterium sp. TaxID=51671 RepID=UPI003C72ACDF